ncbi:hypothetical protein B0H10DRAFT_2222579 [Mycena sp. CBHHK59/15]|nr:hypothetical protein B0H10DRAFT_2222579 [Mycena sp. CBHHK59/15]
MLVRNVPRVMYTLAAWHVLRAARAHHDGHTGDDTELLVWKHAPLTPHLLPPPGPPHNHRSATAAAFASPRTPRNLGFLGVARPAHASHIDAYFAIASSGAGHDGYSPLLRARCRCSPSASPCLRASPSLAHPACPPARAQHGLCACVPSSTRVLGVARTQRRMIPNRWNVEPVEREEVGGACRARPLPKPSPSPSAPTPAPPSRNSGEASSAPLPAAPFHPSSRSQQLSFVVRGCPVHPLAMHVPLPHTSACDTSPPFFPRHDNFSMIGIG